MLSLLPLFAKANKTYWRQAGVAFFIIICCSTICAQNNNTPGSLIKGVVLYKNNTVINATVLLQLPGDSSFVKGTLTDSTGNFIFPDVKAGKYYLSVQSVGHQFHTTEIFSIDSIYEVRTLPPVSLDSTAAKLLEEVVVKTRKPLIERKAGKLIFNVENSTVAIGNTAWDILKKTPSVRSNEQGYVSLKANTPAAIMINNKLVEVSGSGLVDLLSAINWEDVSKIEVITNPSSSYDAEGSGGLINIVTKKNKEDGINGNVNVGYEQNTYGKYTNGIGINYKQGKLNASLSHQYKNGEYFTKEYLDQEYNNEGVHTLYNEQLNRYRKQVNNTTRLNVNYNISKKSSIGIMVDGIWGKWHNKDRSQTPIYGNKNSIDSSFLSDIFINGDKNYLSLNTNYKGVFDTLGKSIDIDLDYLQFGSGNHSVNINNVFDADNNLIRPANMFRSSLPQMIRIFTAKLDYIYPLNHGTSLSLGAKVNKTNTDNNYLFENYVNNVYLNDTGKSNHFNYEENIIALYGEVTKTINNFTLQAGLRGEYTNTKGNSLTLRNVVDRSYINIFPSIDLQQKFNDNYQLELNYGYRINRPSYEDMNPFRYYSTPYSSNVGNPFLKPSYTHSFTLVNTFKSKYSISLYYLKNKDEFLQVPEQDNKTKSIIFRQLNLDKSTMYGISLEAPFELGGWWQSYNSVAISHLQVYYPYLGSIFSSQKNMVSISSNQSFVFSPKWSAEVNATYQSPGIGGLFHLGSYSEIDMGIKRKLLKDKATISLNISDMFRGTIMPATIMYLDQNSTAKTDNDVRGLRIVFSYKFGKSKIKQVSERDAGNKEEQTRITK